VRDGSLRADSGSGSAVRILQVADFYWPHLGGVEQHVRTLARSLADDGHDVHVATTRTGDLPAIEADGRVTVHRIDTTASRFGRLFSSSERPWSPPLPDPEAMLALRRLVGRLRPDVVHGHDWLARSYLPLARGARRRYGTRYVTSQHYYTLSCAKKDLIRATTGERCEGPSPSRCPRCVASHYGPLRGPLTYVASVVGARAELARADNVIAVSRATAVGNGLEVDKVSIIGNPVAVTNGAPEPQVNELLRHLPERFILFVGDLRPMKGLDVLLAAYESLETTSAVPPLVLIGKVWPDTPSSFPAGVTIFERWPNPAVLAAWERAMLGVVPSVWAEPFGIVAVEALRGSTPVIASRVGGLPEIVRDGVEGLLVPPGDAHELAAAMTRLVDDGELRTAMSSAARARASDFAPELISERIQRTYHP
jgi:glycosyltransferase involved in cell wall biosynthesis